MYIDMGKTVVSKNKLTAIANAIRSKNGKTELLKLDEMPKEIEALETGSGGSTESEDDLITGNSSVYRNDRVTSTCEYSFYQHNALEEVDLPNVTEIGAYSFQRCGNLKRVNLPKVEVINAQAFRFCSSLLSVNFPNATGTLSTYQLQDCTSLVRVDLGSNISAIASNSMSGCSVLETVIVRRQEKIATLQGVAAFRGTLIESGNGYIYVPKELIENYKTATNWSTYANQFRAIEDYPEICG